MKVLQVGALPNPIVGISIHVERLSLACHEIGIQVEVFDPHSGRKKMRILPFRVVRPNSNPLVNLASLLFHLLKFDGEVIHFHSSRMGNFLKAAPAFIWLSKAKKIISVHGSFQHSWQDYNSFQRFLTKLFLKRANHIIVGNESIKFLMVHQMGVQPSQISIIPFFLPPSEGDFKRATQNGQRFLEAKAFIEKYPRCALICGSFDKLYGFHTLVDAIREYQIYDIGFIFVFYSRANQEYRDFILKNVNYLPNIKVFEDLFNNEFLSILRNVDLFIRASSQDGDSIALREAIHLGKRVIATDAVTRPEGCLLFRYGDANGLASKILEAVKDEKTGICENAPSYFEKIYNIYDKLL